MISFITVPLEGANNKKKTEAVCTVAQGMTLNYQETISLYKTSGETMDLMYV